MKKTLPGFIKIFSITVLSIFIVSCNELISSNDTSCPVDNTVYASECELEEIAEAGFVNYKIARYYALGALENFQDDPIFKEGELSKFPVIIYNSQTNLPRYYEFKVLNNKIPVAGITCVATKGEGLPVKYVLPYSKTVENSQARAVAAGNAKFVDTGYPSKLVIKGSASLRSATDENDAEKELSILEVLETFSEEELQELNLADKSVQEDVKAEVREEQQKIAEIWNQIDEVSENIINLTEEELMEIYFSEETERKIIYNDYSIKSVFKLENWIPKSNWYQPEGIFCGPSTVAFIMLELGKNKCKGYDGTIPDVEEIDDLNNYYATVEKQIGKGPKTFGILSSRLFKYTNGNYKLESCKHSHSVILEHMESEGLPCVSLRCGKSSSSKAFHYRTVLGLKTEKVRTILKVFGYKKTLLSWNDHFYWMHDNGADGENFYENANKLYEISACKLVKVQ